MIVLSSSSYLSIRLPNIPVMVHIIKANRVDATYFSVIISSLFIIPSKMLIITMINAKDRNGIKTTPERIEIIHTIFTTLNVSPSDRNVVSFKPLLLISTKSGCFVTPENEKNPSFLLGFDLLFSHH